MVHSKDKCMAKDRSRCPYHGHGRGGVDKSSYPVLSFTAFKTMMGFGKPAPTIFDASPGEVVAAAAEAPLEWQGAKPKWWSKFVKTAESHSYAPVTPKLLDIIDSPVGKLAVVWQDESHFSNDKIVIAGSGFTVNLCSFHSVETGENLGHLKMSFVTDASMERAFGDDEFTPFRWQARFGGSSGSYGFKPGDNENFKYGERNLEGDALVQKRRQVWVAATKDLRREGITLPNGERVESRNISSEHVPDDEQVKKDLAVYSSEIEKNMVADRGSSTPLVDHSRIQAALQGKGFGSALYVYGARVLGSRGQTLQASSIQTDYAKKVWRTFGEKFPENVKPVTVRYGNSEVHSMVLDFRE